jgi:1-acyl-sn-glycerol-3-phosphate acyltransferase
MNPNSNLERTEPSQAPAYEVHINETKPASLCRRVSIRWITSIPVLVTYRNAELTDTSVGGWTTSITKGGLSLRLSAPLPRDTRSVKVDVLGSNRTFQHVGKIAWLQARLAVYGIQLQEIDPNWDLFLEEKRDSPTFIPMDDRRKGGRRQNGLSVDQERRNQEKRYFEFLVDLYRKTSLSDEPAEPIKRQRGRRASDFTAPPLHWEKTGFVRGAFPTVRRIANYYKARSLIFLEARIRAFNTFRIKYRRQIVEVLLRFWVGRVEGMQNIPIDSACIIVSNHSSYSDFLIIAAILNKKTVIVASEKLKTTKFMSWFLRLNKLIYVNPDKSTYRTTREIMAHLNQNKQILIYPEGTRSRSGKMLIPKPGFVKMAMAANVPIVPVSMKGTYKILPPDKIWPRFRKCEVIVGKPFYINAENEEIKDLFLPSGLAGGTGNKSALDFQMAAIRIMNKIRIKAEIYWDESALEYFLMKAHVKGITISF